MKHFTVYDPLTGAIFRTGECQDHMVSAQALPHEAAFELQSYPESQAIDLASLQLIDKPPQAPAVESYQLRRIRAYPPIGDQLDVLWKEMRNLPLTAEADEMLRRIQAVKDRHPKET